MIFPGIFGRKRLRDLEELCADQAVMIAALNEEIDSLNHRSSPENLKRLMTRNRQLEDENMGLLDQIVDLKMAKPPKIVKLEPMYYPPEDSQ